MEGVLSFVIPKENSVNFKHHLQFSDSENDFRKSKNCNHHFPLRSSDLTYDKFPEISLTHPLSTLACTWRTHEH